MPYEGDIRAKADASRAGASKPLAAPRPGRGHVPGTERGDAESASTYEPAMPEVSTMRDFAENLSARDVEGAINEIRGGYVRSQDEEGGK